MGGGHFILQNRQNDTTHKKAHYIHSITTCEYNTLYIIHYKIKDLHKFIDIRYRKSSN